MFNKRYYIATVVQSLFVTGGFFVYLKLSHLSKNNTQLMLNLHSPCTNVKVYLGNFH